MLNPSIFITPKQFILFIFIAGLSACASDSDDGPSSESGEISESIGEVKNIQNSEAEKSNRPLISAVSDAITDQSGNIYLADPRTFTLHSFTNNMEHRWSAGGRGRGPGTFMRISSLSILNERLYVYDSATSKMTIYDLNGEKQEEWNYNEAGVQIDRIHSFGEGKLITPGWNNSGETIVNIYGESMKERQESIVSAADHYATDHPQLEKQIFSDEAGSVLPVTDSEFIYAPFLYPGKLTIYGQSAEGTWATKDTINGYRDIELPVEFQFSENGNNERSHLSGFNPEGGYFHAVYQSISHGVYSLEDGRVAHVSTRLNDSDQWDLIIEYFNPDQNYELEFVAVENFDSSQSPGKIPLWLDSSGAVYVSENSDTPLRIFEVKN